MTLFDVYLAVDWSARNGPGPGKPVKDALWVAELSQEIDLACGESYWPTRQLCLAHLQARLRLHVAAGRRVFIGFDFAFGYPSGFAAALDLAEEGPTFPWRHTWALLDRLLVDEGNFNNRFMVAATLNERCHTVNNRESAPAPVPGPFWGTPVGQYWPYLASTSPVYPFRLPSGLFLERLRATDRFQSGVQPVWKLYGVGSVGSQSITGIPVVYKLREDPLLREISKIWPFETGFSLAGLPPTGPYIIHAEIWPGLVVPVPGLPIRDQAQVRGVVSWLAALDTAGELAPLFAPPAGLPDEAIVACLNEEGWILGASRNRLKKLTS